MTTTYTREDIRKKANELAKMMTETEEIDFYKRAEKQINDHSDVQQMISQIKNFQKEAVNLQHYGKAEALKEVEDKIDALHDEIDEIPLVQQFKRSQTDVNELLQMVSNTISRTVTAAIEAENSNEVSSSSCSLKGR